MNASGESLLDRAIFEGYTEIAEALIDAGEHKKLTPVMSLVILP